MNLLRLSCALCEGRLWQRGKSLGPYRALLLSGEA